MTVEQLAQYLSTQSPGIQTNGGLALYYIDNAISSDHKFEIEELDFSFCLFTEDESLHEFLEGYKIENFSDLEELGYKHIWIRYLNREADMEVTQLEFVEAPLNFRLHKMKTMVFSSSLHFYDEVYEHLTLPEDFIRYFFENQAKLDMAVANRYKF